VAKWYVFSAAVANGNFALAIIGVLTSVVAVFFYIRVIVQMYMVEPSAEVTLGKSTRPATVAIAVSLAIVFYLGVLPGRLLELAATSVTALF
jgi:NADH-quinone oxidoreductase subunit N